MKIPREVAAHIEAHGKATRVNADALFGLATVASPPPPGIPEDVWQEMVVNLAVTHGWTVAHCRKVKITQGKRTWWETTMPKGWFDLVLVREDLGCKGHLYVELKVPPNKQAAEQKEWERIMVACGQNCHLWYPEHWPAIVRLLTQPRIE